MTRRAACCADAWRRIDFGLYGGDDLGVDLCPDRRVDQLPHRLGQRLVDAPQPFHLVGAEVLDREIQHEKTRTCFYCWCRVGVSYGFGATSSSAMLSGS